MGGPLPALCLLSAALQWTAVQAGMGSVEVSPPFPEIVTVTSGEEASGQLMAPRRQLPVVIWHGLGDNCCFPLSIGGLLLIIEANLPGVYVKSLMIGSNPVEDRVNGFLMNAEDQVEWACRLLAKDKRLRGGYHALGVSQGALLFRAVAQRCPYPKISTFVSLGGPQQGVFGFPSCRGETSPVCEELRRAMDVGMYAGPVQKRLAPAAYWHDPLQGPAYRHASLLLADINQERGFNAKYKKRLASLDRLVLVKFLQDEVVDPPESEWFGFYAPGSDRRVAPLNASALYSGDLLGLRALDRQGRLVRLTVDGPHCTFSQTWFINEILHKYLRG